MIGNNQFTNPYTEEQKEFLLQFKDTNIKYKEIALLFNKRFNQDKSKSAIRDICSKLGFKKRNPSKTILSNEQLSFLEQNYKGISRKELQTRFNEKFNKNLSENAIKQICNYRGWNNGISGKFGNKPGYKPWNIGLSKEEFYSHYDEGAVKKNCENMHASNRKYKKGDIVLSHGSPFIVIEDKEVDVWMHRIKSMGRYVYEKAYGEIPEGYKIIYKDNNPWNYKLDNLLCVSNQEIMMLAKYNAFGLGNITEALCEVSKTQTIIKEFEQH